MSYSTPRAFERALQDRAKQTAHRHGLDVGHVLRGFYFQRLAARVFRADPDRWVLKGGQALLIRNTSQARMSRDIDLQRLASESPAEALQALREAASLNLDDFLNFAPTKNRSHADVLGGATQSFDVTLGVRKVTSVNVDVITGRHPTQAPQEQILEPVIEIPWPTDWPSVRLYPLADHIADKICAMYTWYKGNPSGRYRDLADLLLICQQDSVHGGAVQAALASEKARREGLGFDLRLPASFEVPAPSWQDGYKKEAAAVTGLRGCSTLDEATVAAEAFLSPILGPPLSGEWDPIGARWGSPAKVAPERTG